MKYVIGLGNPGKSHERSRHNAGFMIIDKIAEANHLAFKAGKGSFLMGEAQIASERVYLVKPTTYMNHSGEAVQRLVSYYKADLSDLLIVYDDVALPLGKIRVRESGSSGGQKGVESIIYHLQSEDFARVRIGIANPEAENIPLTRFVLTNFRKDEAQTLAIVLKIGLEVVEDWIQFDTGYVMNKYNGLGIAN